VRPIGLEAVKFSSGEGISFKKETQRIGECKKNLSADWFGLS